MNLASVSNTLGVLALAGCSFQPGALSPDSSVTPPTGPTLSTPTDQFMLAPTRAFLSWKRGEAPEGRAIESYEVCSTNNPSINIEDTSECPNQVLVMRLFQVLSPLASSTNYRWKVRTRYDNGDFSEWSALRTF